MILGAVVLAAGQGTRMKSALPKVLHPLAGRPMIGWVLGALGEVDVAQTVVVVGHGAEAVAAALPDGVMTCVQEVQHGTGHATGVGVVALPAECDAVLVVCGDTPLLSGQLFVDLVEQHRRTGAVATMVTTVLPDAGAYGRVVRTPPVRSPASSKRATPRSGNSRSVRSMPGSSCSTGRRSPRRSGRSARATRKARSICPMSCRCWPGASRP